MFKYLALLVLAAGVAVLVSACARVYPPAERLPGPTPTPVAQALLPVHGDVGKANCLACHLSQEKFTEALQSRHPVAVPPGFKGSSNEACALCHVVGESHTVGPSIAHSLEGMKECMACHGGGVQGVTKAPADHKGYNAEACTLCHAPATD